jgi:hypothetical protein
MSAAAQVPAPATPAAEPITKLRLSMAFSRILRDSNDPRAMEQSRLMPDCLVAGLPFP